MKDMMTNAQRNAKWASRVAFGIALVLAGVGRFGMDNPHLNISSPGWLYAVGIAIGLVGIILMSVSTGFAVKREVATWLTIGAACTMIIGACGTVLSPGPWPVVIAIVSAGLFVLGMLGVKTCPMFPPEPKKEDNVEQKDGGVSSESALSDELSS